MLLIGDVTGNIVVPSNYVEGYYPPVPMMFPTMLTHFWKVMTTFRTFLIGRLSVLSPSELQTIVQKNHIL